MGKQRHRQRNQGGTTTETRPQTGSGVAQFSVSEVAQFSMSVDTSSGEQNGEGAAVTTMGEGRRGRSDGTDPSHGPTSGGP
jgi:hypothetical protein